MKRTVISVTIIIEHSWHCEVDEEVVAEIGDEILGNKNWVEKLRAQEKALAAEIRKLMDSSQDQVTTWATLRESLSRDWGADASIIAGLILTMTATAKTAKIWMTSKFKGAGQVNAGPVAKQFLNDNSVEDVFEVFGADEYCNLHTKIQKISKNNERENRTK